jgi:hypothetical protein
LSGRASVDDQKAVATAGLKSGDAARTVSSNFSGQFKMGEGVLALPLVTFDVPGAVVEMTGRYAMVPETIDFSGNLFMDAKISETMTGWKAMLLKVADPLFRKNGRTVIPLKVSGSRNDPKFGLDVKRALRRDVPEAPRSVGTRGKDTQGGKSSDSGKK